MKFTGLVRTSVLISLVGTAGLMCAQEQRDEAKPQQEEAKPENAKPARDEMKPPRQEEAKPPKQEEAKPPRQEEVKPPKQEEHNPSRNEGKNETRENARPAQSEHAGAQSGQHAHQAGGQRGGHIPDDKFRANFGREHKVVINRPTVVEGQPRFQYGGYWFTIVDAWPADWAYTDDCYIDYIDGEYYLIDLLHPGVRVALFVVM